MGIITNNKTSGNIKVSYHATGDINEIKTRLNVENTIQDYSSNNAETEEFEVNAYVPSNPETLSELFESKENNISQRIKKITKNKRRGYMLKCPEKRSFLLGRLMRYRIYVDENDILLYEKINDNNYKIYLSNGLIITMTEQGDISSVIDVDSEKNIMYRKNQIIKVNFKVPLFWILIIPIRHNMEEVRWLFHIILKNYYKIH